MYPRSMADSDCVVVMGSNMAENHPVAFRWPMQAKVEHGAKLIHVDPRFTRTSAVSDIYAPIRAGSDIAFLGGIIRHVIQSERWNSDPFFRSWVGTYTNAATIINPDYKDAEDNDGVFSGFMEYKGGVPEWPYNGSIGQYDNQSWHYHPAVIGDQGTGAATAQSAQVKGITSGTSMRPPRGGHHGAARPCLDPGIDRRADAVSLDSRIPAGSDSAEEPRHPPPLPGGRNRTDGLLRQHAQVRGLVSQIHVRRGRDSGQPFRLRLPPQHSAPP